MSVRTLRVLVALAAALFASGIASGDVGSSFNVTTFSEATELGGQAFENSVLGQDGTAYYTDHVAHVIRAVDLQTGEITLIAGTEGTSGFQDGDLSTALLFQPRGACVSPCDGHLYFVDGGGALLRQLNFKQRVIVTVAGTPGQKGFKDGEGPAARFSFARAPLCLANGTIIVADSSSHPALRTVHPPANTQCGGQPTPKPAPSPSSASSSADMLVHKLVLVVACSVLAIIAAFMLIKVHAAAWVHGRIQAVRDRHAGPPRSSLPDNDEEQTTPPDHYEPPKPMIAADPEALSPEPGLLPRDLISLRTPTPSSRLSPVPGSPCSTSTGVAPATTGSSYSGTTTPASAAAAAHAGPASKPDPFADLTIDLL